MFPLRLSLKCTQCSLQANLSHRVCDDAEATKE